MKRVLVGIMAALVLAAGTTSSFALNSETMTTEIGQNFADADGDGICDNTVSSLRYIDANGDGVCDNLGTYQRSGANGNSGNSANSNGGSRSGRNYVDADGDGVCDNNGSSCRYVDANGDGVCDNAVTSLRYVDTDGDGVCDNLGTYQRSGANGNGGNSVNNNASSGNGQGKNFANSNAGSRSGRNYTDADGDGVCDYYNGCHGAGRGNGFQHGRNR